MKKIIKIKSKKIVKAVHALKKTKPDPAFEIGLSKYLRRNYTQNKLLELYTLFQTGNSDFNILMRRTIWRAIARKFGNGVFIDSNVEFKHLETFEIGNNVFIGTQTFIQGRFDGKCKIGNHVWIGPKSYLDARNLIIEDFVGLGPGTKILGSTHTALPINISIIKTNLEIKPVRIQTGSDIGTNSVLLPGVTIGKGSIVGAGAIVTKDVPPFAIAAGIPAKFLKWRKGYRLQKKI